MAVSSTELQVLWSTANSLSVSSGSTGTSDALTIAGTAYSLEFTLKADNDGTPASGDTVTFSLLATTGDPDGASTDEFSTTDNKIFLATVDTNSTDPSIAHAVIQFAPKEIKIYAENDSAGRAITVSCNVLRKDA